MEAGADDNQRIMTSESSSKNAGHNAGYHPTLPIPLSPPLTIGGSLRCGGSG
jgi:hypothetical protein